MQEKLSHSSIKVDIKTMFGEIYKHTYYSNVADWNQVNFKNQVYVRTESSVHKADIETVKDMILRKQIAPERWERRFSSADIENDVCIYQQWTT